MCNENRPYNKYAYTRHLRTVTHKKRALLNQVQPNGFQPRIRCSVCNKAFEKKESYRRHLRCVHKLGLPALKPKPDFSITPNPHNASNHCDSCNWTFVSMYAYRRHLQLIHKMVTTTLGKRAKPNPSIVPDIDDPNYYCKSCQTTQKTYTLYRQHLRDTHKIQLAPLKRGSVFDPTISIADTENPNNRSCAICKFTYSSIRNYHKHMERGHKSGKNAPMSRSLRLSNINTQPDPNDPTFFCQPCQKQYANNRTYQSHIRLVHSDKVDTAKLVFTNPIMVEVDNGNLNNKNCTICDREYSNRSNYVTHMNTWHKDGNRQPVVKRGERSKIDHNVMPIWDDPNKYCRSCKRGYSDKTNYRIHVRSIHRDNIAEIIQQSSSTA